VTVHTFFDEYNEDAEDYGVVQAYVNPAFPEHRDMEGWSDGWLYANADNSASEGHSFHAGSYSGYGSFRRRLAYWHHVEEVWADPEGHKNIPYFWIINFSDCEGTIGPVVSELLYTDFSTKRKNFIAKYSDTPMAIHYLNVYDNFTRAFELGKDNGLVIFH
jgi:hypothetical protein